jgi:hypothetical protein
MIRFIRLAAVLGILLALVDFCWTAIDAPRAHQLFDFDAWRAHGDHTGYGSRLHAAIREQYQSGIGFAVSGILYVLATRAASGKQPNSQTIPSPSLRD